MVSLTHLQPQINKLFDLARKDGLTIKVHHRKRVFLLTIDPTGETYSPMLWWQRKKRAKKSGVILKATTCQECTWMKVQGVCLNRKCPTNIKPAPKT